MKHCVRISVCAYTIYYYAKKRLIQWNTLPEWCWTYIGVIFVCMLMTCGAAMLACPDGTLPDIQYNSTALACLRHKSSFTAASLSQLTAQSSTDKQKAEGHQLPVWSTCVTTRCGRRFMANHCFAMELTILCLLWSPSWHGLGDVITIVRDSVCGWHH